MDIICSEKETLIQILPKVTFNDTSDIIFMHVPNKRKNGLTNFRLWTEVYCNLNILANEKK